MATGCANHGGVEDARFVREEMAQWVLADELGFESLWITEHHFSDYSMSPDPLMYLAWLAGRCPRLRLGTQVLVVPWHDPVRLAEQIIVLDHLCGGRAIIGFGRGLARSEYIGLRIPQTEARERFDETVSLVMQALETGWIEGGEIFRQPRRELRPRPVRSLAGRAFSGAGTQESLISAAKLGLGRLYLNQPTFEGSKDVWAEAWQEYHPNDPPPRPFVTNLVFVDESSERAHEIGRKYATTTFRHAIEHYELNSAHHGSVKGYEAYKQYSPEELEKQVEAVAEAAVCGTPREVLEKLEGVVRLRDPQGLYPHLYTGGMPHDEAVRNMTSFARHCLREVQSWPAVSTIDGPKEAA
jgi:alkanesulfonate monooxygenase SsuD/methylene tetrahydromethanopterin reductase-like flavin-dependent oxidoreductase (luciferase family)